LTKNIKLIEELEEVFEAAISEVQNDTFKAMKANNIGALWASVENYENALKWFEHALSLDNSVEIIKLNIDGTKKRIEKNDAQQRHLHIRPASPGRDCHGCNGA
jgi:tetratricopeptide (TPR) repeat protein